MDVQESSGRVDLRLQTRPKREVVAFGKLMAALAMMKARDPLIGFQVEVFEDRTVHVPLPVMVKAVQIALDTMQWRPVPEELLQLCEQVRREIRGAQKYDPCAQCDETGWESIEVDGVKRMRRCGCWKRHQEKVQALGVGSDPLCLPPGTIGETE